TPLPIRLAGTIRVYSKNAMPQLTRMAITSGALLYFRCPYQAKVMNTLLASSNSTGTREFDRGDAGIVGPEGGGEARRIVHRRGPGGPGRGPPQAWRRARAGGVRRMRRVPLQPASRLSAMPPAPPASSAGHGGVSAISNSWRDTSTPITAAAETASTA